MRIKFSVQKKILDFRNLMRLFDVEINKQREMCLCINALALHLPLFYNTYKSINLVAQSSSSHSSVVCVPLHCLH